MVGHRVGTPSAWYHNLEMKSSYHISREQFLCSGIYFRWLFGVTQRLFTAISHGHGSLVFFNRVAHLFKRHAVHFFQCLIRFWLNPLRVDFGFVFPTHGNFPAGMEYFCSTQLRKAFYDKSKTNTDTIQSKQTTILSVLNIKEDIEGVLTLPRLPPPPATHSHTCGSVRVNKILSV